MTTEELQSVLSRVSAMSKWVAESAPLAAALAFLLNRFEKTGQMPTEAEFMAEYQREHIRNLTIK